MISKAGEDFLNYKSTHHTGEKTEKVDYFKIKLW